MVELNPGNQTLVGKEAKSNARKTRVTPVAEKSNDIETYINFEINIRKYELWLMIYFFYTNRFVEALNIRIQNQSS